MEQTTDATLGKRIKSYREKAGMTQEEVAEALSVSRQAVGKWETDQSRPSTGNLIRLAQILGIDLEALIRDSGETEAESSDEAKELPDAADTSSEEGKARETCQTASPKKRTAIGLVLAGLVLLGVLIIPAFSAFWLFGSRREEDRSVQLSVFAESPSVSMENRSVSMESPSVSTESRQGDVSLPEQTDPGDAGPGGAPAGIGSAPEGPGSTPEGPGSAPEGIGSVPAGDGSILAGDRSSEADMNLPEGDSDSNPLTDSAAAAFPEFLTVTGQEYRGFGDTPGRDEIVEAADVADDLLFQYRFSDSSVMMVFYRERSESTDAQGNPKWHLMAAYDLGNGQYRTVARIAEDEPGAGFPALSAFEALGYRGCKVVVWSWQFDFPDTYYFALSDDGLPMLWGLRCGRTAEADIDADGENEILSLEDPWGAYTIIDRGTDDYTAYTITDELPEGSLLSYGRVPDTETGEKAVLVTAPDGSWAAYRHLWDGRLVREAVNYSAAGMEELDAGIARTVLTFAGLQDAGPYPISDGTDPDLPFEGRTDLPTHRQLAYLGLQTLYDLTGIRLERCYVQASENGVYYNLEPNFDGQGFMSFDRGTRWGSYEKAVMGLTISWRQPYTEFSPLDPALMELPEKDPASMARWVYEHVPLLWEGEIVSSGSGLRGDIRLFLEDGRFFEVSFDDALGLPGRIQGPYPKGFEH